MINKPVQVSVLTIYTSSSSLSCFAPRSAAAEKGNDHESEMDSARAGID